MSMFWYFLLAVAMLIGVLLAVPSHGAIAESARRPGLEAH
jgi:hypothetical protein